MIKLGFLNKIFGKKQEEKFEEIKMSLKEVEDFIANKLKKDLEPLKESAKKDYKKEHTSLKLVSSKMRDQLKVLEQATYSERTYPMLIRKAVGGRKSFVNKMNILIKQTQKPIEEDMASIINFHNETTKLINITDMKTVREYAFMKPLFEKEGKEVVQSFRQIIEINKRSENIIKQFKESNAQLLKTQEVFDELLNLIEELKNKNETNELEKKLKEKDDKIKNIENELKKLPNSKEWKAFLEMQKIREELKTSMQDKRSDFIQSVVKIEKPLKKYKWPVRNKILDDYVKHSFETILSEDPKGEVFISALKNMKIKIIEGKMDLKNSDKFLSIIKKMIEYNTMGKIIEEYLRLSEELRKQEEKIALQEIPKRKNKLENDVSRLKREMEEIKAEKKRIEERRKELQAYKEQKLKELENLLNDVAGKRIFLEIN